MCINHGDGTMEDGNEYLDFRIWEEMNGISEEEEELRGREPVLRMDDGSGGAAGGAQQREGRQVYPVQAAGGTGLHGGL